MTPLPAEPVKGADLSQNSGLNTHDAHLGIQLLRSGEAFFSTISPQLANLVGVETEKCSVEHTPNEVKP